MTEYIKREDVIALAWDVTYKDEWYMHKHDKVVSVSDIAEIPSADVVEVVRCKDCVKANADSDERYMYCTKCHEYKLIDYYCAEGRRDDG